MSITNVVRTIIFQMLIIPSQDWPTLDEIKERVNGTLSNDFVMLFIKLDMDLGVCYSRLTKALEQYDHYIASVKSASGEVNPEKISDGKKILQEFVEIDEKISNLGWELQNKMETGTGQVFALFSLDSLTGIAG